MNRMCSSRSIISDASLANSARRSSCVMPFLSAIQSTPTWDAHRAPVPRPGSGVRAVLARFRGDQISEERHQRALRAAGGPNPPHPLVPFRGAPTHSKPAEASVGIARITVSKVAEQRNHPGAPIRNGGPLNYHLLATSQSRHLEYREYNIIRVSWRRSANIPLRG